MEKAKSIISEKITNNFSWYEFERSQKAIDNNIDNTVSSNLKPAAINLFKKAVQPFRDFVASPLSISSGYRNDKVNALVGGENTSQHKKAEAVDLQSKKYSAIQLFDLYKKSGLPYDQLIVEKGKNGAEWLHLSLKLSGANRFQAMAANYNKSTEEMDYKTA